MDAISTYGEMSQITDSDDSRDQAPRSPKKRSPQKQTKRNKKSPRKLTNLQVSELVNTCFNTSAKVVDLIQRVERYTWLYDKHSGNYKTNTMRNNAWTSIAKEIGLDPAYGARVCKKKWTNLKDYYLREHAKVRKTRRSGCGAKDVFKSKWQYFDVCRFLDGKTIVSRRNECEPALHETSQCSSQPQEYFQAMIGKPSMSRESQECSPDQEASRDMTEDELPEFDPSPACRAAQQGELGRVATTPEPPGQLSAAASRTPGTQRRKRKRCSTESSSTPVEQALHAAATNLRTSGCPPEHKDEIGQALLHLRLYVKKYNVERQMQFFRSVTDFAHDLAMEQSVEDKKMSQEIGERQESEKEERGREEREASEALQREEERLEQMLGLDPFPEDDSL